MQKRFNGGRRINDAPARHIERLFSRSLAGARHEADDTQLAGLARAAAWEAERDTGSAQFRRRCQDAALTAHHALVSHHLAKMAAERERVGFQPLPLSQYVETLAQSVGADLGLVMKWAGISGNSSDGSRVTLETAAPWVRICHGLGMELRQILLHVRLSVIGVPGLAQGRARARAEDAVELDSLEHCERFLIATERVLDKNARQALASVLAEVRQADDEVSSRLEP